MIWLLENQAETERRKRLCANANGRVNTHTACSDSPSQQCEYATGELIRRDDSTMLRPKGTACRRSERCMMIVHFGISNPHGHPAEMLTVSRRSVIVGRSAVPRQFAKLGKLGEAAR